MTESDVNANSVAASQKTAQKFSQEYEEYAIIYGKYATHMNKKIENLRNDIHKCNRYEEMCKMVWNYIQNIKNIHLDILPCRLYIMHIA